MALSDLILKAKVNMALAQHAEVSMMETTVEIEDGLVTLTGDLDSEETCRTTEQVVASVEGVVGVKNELTCGARQEAATAELVTLRLLEKLDDEWHKLPNVHAYVQADYVRWALWLIYKFRLPPGLNKPDHVELENDAMDVALTRVAGYVGSSKAMLAIEMLRQAEQVKRAPDIDAPGSQAAGLHPQPLANSPILSPPPTEGDLTG